MDISTFAGMTAEAGKKENFASPSLRHCIFARVFAEANRGNRGYNAPMIDSAAGLRRILGEYRSVAVVGLSPKEHRPSFFAAKYLLAHGYRIFPVNPNHSEILGCKCYPTLAAIPEAAQIADCFRRAEEMPALAKEAAAAGARVFWMQIGAHSDEAAQIAEAAGMEAVGDRCMKIEHGRLFGGLHFAGVNTGVISARRRGAKT